MSNLLFCFNCQRSLSKNEMKVQTLKKPLGWIFWRIFWMLNMYQNSWSVSNLFFCFISQKYLAKHEMEVHTMKKPLGWIFFNVQYVTNQLVSVKFVFIKSKYWWVNRGKGSSAVLLFWLVEQATDMTLEQRLYKMNFKYL